MLKSAFALPFSWRRIAVISLAVMLPGLLSPTGALATDPIARLQAQAVKTNQADWAHWGTNPDKYSTWKTHTNRLVPIYTFGGDLQTVIGKNSVYRCEAQLTELYGQLPTNTVNPEAEYCDQTDVFRLQQWAVRQGKKRIALFVFDGMDWQTTRAAAIAKSGCVAYQDGRGEGLAFQDYRGVETDFGYLVTSPHNTGTSVNVDDQIVKTPGGKIPGGYDASRASSTPWAPAADPLYPISAGDDEQHAYTDSAASATSLTSGIKTYNNAINVDFSGREVLPIARQLQADGFAVGVVTSVPVSHATPACAYANNVHRGDYQDLTRDMLGLPSAFHPGGLPGLDVLIGAGWGEDFEKDGGQGKNFVPGNKYLSAEDQDRISLAGGGRYVVAERTSGKPGTEVLGAAVTQSIQGGHRLFGFFGVGGGHLPFQTANGDFAPVDSFGSPKPDKAEVYSEEDIAENVTLADMTLAAVDVLDSRSERWWLMVEAGDVDWANHSNNIDNSIGAVFSGEEAFRRLAEWIESHGGWDDTLVIVTADHGHYLVLDRPEVFAGAE